MERHAFAMKVKSGKMNDYRKKLGEIWPDLTTFLDRNKVKNFSIWNAEDLIFGYYENEDGTVLSEEENAAKDAITAKIRYAAMEITEDSTPKSPPVNRKESVSRT